MAQVERQREDNRDNKRSRARQSKGRRATANGTYVLASSDWIHIAALCEAFIEAGGALRIGLTRDGGALSIGCYVGDDYGTEYVRPSENLETALAEIAEAWLPDGLTLLQSGYEKLRAK